jgi:leucyl-tRNA synthetase
MLQMRNQGQILGPDGQRMSKSRGNVVDPDVQVKLYGADTVRAYLMFGYRWQDGGPWAPGNIQGSHRWLGRVWNTFLEEGVKGDAPSGMDKSIRRKVHQTLKSVSRDFEEFEFNTVISALMELMNELVVYKEKGGWGTPVWKEAVDIYLRMMAPATPHIAEDLWSRLGKPYSVHQQPWPEVDEAATVEDEYELVIQVNGKVREKINVPVNTTEEIARQLSLEQENIKRILEGKQPKKVIFVPGRLINIVI